MELSNFNKKEIGLYVGRFQPFTNGHAFVIKEALQKCDVLVVAIGSTQEYLTKKNPFSASFRGLLISKVFEKQIMNQQIIMCFIPDREHPKDDEGWGRYLLSEVQRQTGLKPTKIFEGQESVRNYWFNERVRRETISKTIIPITASRIREFIKNDDYENFVKFMPDEINSKKYFNYMREIICSIKED